MKKSILLAIAASLIFTGCSKKTQNDKNCKINIVTTTFPCFDASRACLGEYYQKNKGCLKLLVKPGAEVHSFDPSPADIININNSDLFIFVGGESDEWVEKLFLSLKKNSSTRYLKLFDCVETIDEVEFEENDECEHHELHEHHAHHENNQNAHEQDEHIWTNPQNEIQIVNEVSSAICTILDKKNQIELKAEILKNAQNYIEEIKKVENKTKQIIASKNEKFMLFGDRFPFVYYCNYYGLEFDAAFSGCSTAVEASTATISRLIDKIESKHLPAVFYIELGNHKIADTIANSTKIETLLFQSCQNVSKNDFENGETWVSLMQKNADNLAQGLR